LRGFGKAAPEAQMLIVLGVMLVGMFGIAGTFLTIEEMQRKQGDKSLLPDEDGSASPDRQRRG
jgi:hypothetical protein